MMLSPAGVFSGTSGRQKTTQEWISAKLNCPTRLSLFMGLDPKHKTNSIIKLTNIVVRNKRVKQRKPPVLVDAVCALVKRQRFDVILPNLTCLGLQSVGDISLQGAILPFDGPHLQHAHKWTCDRESTAIVG